MGKEAAKVKEKQGVRLKAKGKSEEVGGGGWAPWEGGSQPGWAAV
jgi:hypothetical protein